MVCKSYIGQYFMYSVYFLQLKLFLRFFPNLNVVAHLVVPVGWGSCLLGVAVSMPANIMASFFGVHLHVCVNNFSKSTRPRDMPFLLKDTLTFEDEKVFKACSSRSVRPFPRAIISEAPPPKM